MSPCNSLFGKIFGHKFKKYLTKRAIPFPSKEISINIEIAGEVMNAMRDIYEIRCKRCGCKTDD